MHSDNVKRSVKASSAISFKRPELLLSSVIFFRSFQVFEWSPKPLFWDDLSKNLEISLVNDMIIFLSTTTIYLSWSEIVTFLTSKQVLPLRKHIQKKKKKMVNAVFKVQFNFLVARRFHTLSWNNKISLLHELCLRITYNNDKHWNSEELLVRSNSVSIYYNNTHIFSIEMFKAANGVFQE